MVYDEYTKLLIKKLGDKKVSLNKLREQATALGRPLNTHEKAALRTSIFSTLFEDKSRGMTKKDYAAVGRILEPIFDAYFDTKEEKGRYIAIKTKGRQEADASRVNALGVAEPMTELEELFAQYGLDKEDTEDELYLTPEEQKISDEKYRIWAEDAAYERWAAEEAAARQEEEDAETEAWCRKEYFDYYAQLPQGDDAE